MHRVSRSIAGVALVTCFSAGILVAQQQPQPQQQQQQPQQQPPLPPNGWRIDMGHSAINFRVRHLGIAWVNGEFRQWQGELIYDPARPEASSVTARIQTASVNTNNERRDNDIRSGNYLAVDSFPEMTFVSRQVQRVDDTHLRITGDLTLRGVTRQVVLETEITGTITQTRARRVAFTATTAINRHDFGVVFNRVVEGAQVVGDEIRITIDIEAIQPISA